jgi:hypothetical protein
MPSAAAFPSLLSATAFSAIVNTAMGNTQYDNGHVTIFSDQTAIKNQHQSLIFSPF